MQSKTEWLDFIKVFGVLATIFLHTNSRLVNFQTSVVDYPVKLNMLHWDISVVFASLAGPSFALIFMYLGARVLSSNHTSISFYFSKVKNLLIPLLFWTVFALLFRKYVMHWDIDIVQQFLPAPFIAVANNLWVLYILIGLFFLTPVLKLFIDHSTTKQQLYLLILWFYAITFPPLIEKYFHTNISGYAPMMTGYIGYMVLGYILTNITLTKRWLQVGALLFTVGNAWVIWGTIHYSPASDVVQGIYANYFFNRFSLPMLLNSIGSFILLRWLAEYLMQKLPVTKRIKTLSSVALGLCMVYPYWFIILGTEKIGIELSAFSGNPLWSVPFTALFTIAGSFVTVWLIKKIPYLHHITPRLY